MTVKVGVIREINRYPVKSFGGEQLEACRIEPYGLEGDRFCSFYDESKEGWARYVTARKIPEMLTYRARYRDGEIEVTAEDGRKFGWDESLLAEIQALSRVPVAMSKPKDPHPEHPGLLSVDGAAILLVTDAGLKRLAELRGHELDQRRFRGNFVVALSDPASFEGDWIGRRLRLGDVELQVDEFCERCVMTTMDPDTAAKDPAVLKIVHREMNLKFGVYASVVRTGEVSLGDEVVLAD
ncbi:MOSC domain-containing protein [Saccharibacillus alkalitolerans]|uniref:MOSC domain-containing protein n=1 Tax=Saccharibacillus alkalitolerans TaxID=2705290 RepID=A0ABX0F5A1_9BACL|nr:MOSC N-terminal beta barrel domain-containing protein [Saccharibacillus alkalitolerans]NGZ74729.1 MOSC domain-containing protein [Saccharibacillus alkalitolerans]